MDDHAPPPPTGPEAEKYHHEDGRPERFVAFLDTPDGQAFWEAVEEAALEALRTGEERFSTRTFLARYRDDEKVRINDHFSPWFADELVARHPLLLDIIERRKRRKAGPPPLPPEPEPEPEPPPQHGDQLRMF